MTGAWNRFEIGNDDDTNQTSKMYHSTYGTKDDSIMGKPSLTAHRYTDPDEDDLSHMAPNNAVDYTVSDTKYMYDDFTENDYIATGDIISTGVNYNNNYTSTLTTMQSDIMLLEHGVSVTSAPYNSGLYPDDAAMMHGNQMIADDRYGPIGVMTTSPLPATTTTSLALPSIAAISAPSTTTTTMADIQSMVTQSQQLLTGDTSNYYCDNSATNVAYNLADVRQTTEDEIIQIDNSSYLRDLYSTEQYVENIHKQLVFNPVSSYIALWTYRNAENSC